MAFHESAEGHFYFGGMMDLLPSFKEYLLSQNMVTIGDHVLLAVSGGMDSVVLLDLFVRIHEELRLTLAVVHYNHSLRGEAADEDERFVQKLARSSGLVCYSHKGDVKGRVKQRSETIEEAARNMRFEFFIRLLRQTSFSKAALAHHADDQNETVLMNLVRGSGLRGLRGLRPIRDCYIHPLLFASRQEIATYRAERALDFVTDRSNGKRDYLRNRIRLDVLPAIEQAFGRPVGKSLNRSAAAICEANDFVESVTEEAILKTVLIHSQDEIVLDIHQFKDYFTLIQKTMLMRLVRNFSEYRVQLDSADVESLVALICQSQSGRSMSLGDGIKAVIDKETLVFLKTRPEIREYDVSLNEVVLITETFQKLECTLLPEKPKDLKRHESGTEYADFDKLRFPLILRSMRPGDRFIPLGMKGMKKVQNFFVDEKVSNYRRSAVPILCNGTDIVCIPGYRLDDRYKVTRETKHVLRITVKDINGPK